MEVTDEAKDWIAKLGYDISYGARPLKRVIQQKLINPLSSRLLEGEFGPGEAVKIVLDDYGQFDFLKE